MSVRRALGPVLAALALATGSARADGLAAVVTGRTSTDVLVVGASGQVWERAAGGDWIRARPGGVAADVQGAVWADGVVVVGKGAPPYRFDGTWQAIRLGERGRTTAGAGPAATIAIGRTAFIWQRGAWVRLATATTPVVAVWAASESRAFVAAGGKLWRPVRKRLAVYATVDVARFGAGPTPWAITASGELYDVTRRAVVAVAPGGTPLVAQQLAVAPDGEPWVLGQRAGTLVMARRAGGWVELPSPPLAVDDVVVGWVVGKDGRSTLATSQGGLWLRDATGAWTSGTRRDALPAGPAGAGPARTP